MLEPSVRALLGAHLHCHRSRGLLVVFVFLRHNVCIAVLHPLQLLLAEWPNILALTAGLIAIKSSIIIALGPLVGLTRPESVRTGFILSQVRACCFDASLFFTTTGGSSAQATRTLSDKHRLHCRLLVML